MSSSDEAAATTISSSSSSRSRTPPVWALVVGVVLVVVAVVAFVASGGTGSSMSLSAWVSQSRVGQSIGTLETDGTHVRTLLATGSGSGAVRTLCAAMSNDAQGANDQLPSPDTKVTQWLARAYGLEYDAAQACYRAGGGATALLARAASDRAAAKRLFGKAIDRIRLLTDETVSTSTAPGLPATGTAFG